MGTNETKSDFLRECMTDPALVSQTVPIDQFCQAFCVVCAYKPCVRSRANQMVFTERVANWRPRMFTNVPRAADNDENYAGIRAKNFQSVDEPLEIRTRPDASPAPENVAPTPVRFTPMTPTESGVQTPEPVQPLVPDLVTPPVITQSATASHQSVPRQVEPHLNNTPFQAGIVLPGKPVDKDEDKFVEPGATFTFGDDE